MRYVAFSIAGLLVLSACSQTPPCEDKYSALTMAHKFVTANLRSPSTADFPVIGAKGVSVRPETLSNGECAFTITTYVDGQNAFGATVRQKFLVTVAPEGGGRYKLIQMSSF